MAARVDRLEVDGQEVGAERSLQRRRQPAIELARRVDLRELREPLRRPSGLRRPGRPGEPRAGGGRVDRRLADFAGDLGAKALRKRRAGARGRALDLVEAEPVRDLEARHLLGGMGRVPADEPRGLPERSGQVPERGRPGAGRSRWERRFRPAGLRRSRRCRGPGARGPSRSTSRRSARAWARPRRAGPRPPRASGARRSGAFPRRRAGRWRACRRRRGRSAGRAGRTAGPPARASPVRGRRRRIRPERGPPGSTGDSRRRWNHRRGRQQPIGPGGRLEEAFKIFLDYIQILGERRVRNPWRAMEAPVINDLRNGPETRSVAFGLLNRRT